MTQNSPAFALNDRSDPDAARAASRRYARLVDRATALLAQDPTIGMLDLRLPGLLRAMVAGEDHASTTTATSAPLSSTTSAKPHKSRDGRQASAPTVDAVSPWRTAQRTSWYGPGFYGNVTACGQRFTARLVGVAHRTLPCGTLVQLRWHGMTVIVPVIDRGPYGNAHNVFDLSAALACHKLRPHGQRDGCFTRHNVKWRVVERRR